MRRQTKILGTLVTLAILIAGCTSSAEAIRQADTPTETESTSVAAPPTAVPVEREPAMVDTDVDGVGYAVDGASGQVEVVWNAETGAVSVDVPIELEGWPWAISAMSAEGIIGEAQIATNSGGWSFTLIADDQYISGQRQALQPATYVSGERPFPVLTANGWTPGVAVHEFEAVTPDRLEGTLAWDNHDGCTGTYPITIELKAPYDFIYDIPEPGMWQLQIDLTSTCGTIAPTITIVDLDVTGGVGGVPALANGGWLSLLVGENGDLASLGSLVLPGVTALVVPTTPPLTPVPTPVLGTIQLVPTAPGSYIGTFIGSPLGTPSCTILGTVQFVRLG